MIDVDATIRAFLMAQPEMTAVSDQRVYASVDLPAGYNISDGPALLYTSQMTPSYPSKLLKGSVTFRCYGNENTARELDRALYDALHDNASKAVKAAHLQTGGQLFQESDTGWYFVLSIYRLVLANP